MLYNNTMTNNINNYSNSNNNCNNNSTEKNNSQLTLDTSMSIYDPCEILEHLLNQTHRRL